MEIAALDGEPGTMSEAALLAVQDDTDLYRDLGLGGHVNLLPDGTGTVALSDWNEFLTQTREDKGPGGTRWLSGMLSRLTENLLQRTDEQQEVERQSRRQIEEVFTFPSD